VNALNQSRSVLLALACAAAAVLGGCSETQAGSPQAAGDATSSQPTSDVPATTKPTPTSNRDKDPCALLSAAETADLGLGAAKTKTVTGLKFCDWASSSSSHQGIAIGYGLSSLDSLNGQSIDIGKHKAAKLPPTILGRGCAVGLALPDSTSVIISGTPKVGEPDDAACPAVNQVAKIIDPKLP
jgi:hypothetical protein